MLILKRLLIVIAALLLAAVLVLTCVTFLSYPRYRSRRQQYNFKVDTAENEIRVMSCNVRCLNPLDTGKKNWFYRADLLVQGIAESAPGIIGFQEVTRWQYNYLTYCLPGYDSVITYRDRQPNSEGCPVFYNTALYSLVDKGSFWLSETPDVMSKDWGAACYRVCSYTILKAKDTGREFVVFNTHLDHVSEEARINGINLVLSKIEQFGSLPAVLMGDLNAGTDSVTYAAATEIFSDAALMTEDSMADSCTYQGFGQYLDSGRIDYFMVSKEGVKVNYYKVIDRVPDGVYPSDHFPILTSLTLTD